MNPAIIVYFLRLILCNPEILNWLKTEAAKSSTPIDDYAVQAISALLCPSK
jgi:hypothetical protein